jgi:hypothetical protein
LLFSKKQRNELRAIRGIEKIGSELKRARSPGSMLPRPGAVCENIIPVALVTCKLKLGLLHSKINLTLNDNFSQYVYFSHVKLFSILKFRRVLGFIFAQMVVQR